MKSLLVASTGQATTALAAKLASRGHAVTRVDLADASLEERFDMLFVLAAPADAEAACRAIFSTTRGRVPVTVFIGAPSQLELERLLRAGVDAFVKLDDSIDLTLAVCEHTARDRALVADLTSELRESEERYRSVVAAMQEGVIVLDRSGNILACNASAERILGLSAEEILASSPRAGRREVIHADGSVFPESDHPATITLRTGEPVSHVVMGLRKLNGETTWLGVSSQPIAAREGGPPSAVVLSLNDLTEVRRSEANFRGLIERAPDGILVHRDGVVLFANPRFVTMLGHDRADECVGRSIFDFVHPEDHAVVVARVKMINDVGRENAPQVERLLRRDGGVVYVEVVGIPIYFDGAPAILAHGRDLTERRRLEAELGTADRLASVGRLAAGVGHEINNPLAYVVGNLDLLAAIVEKDSRGDTTEAKRLLSEAREGADRVRRIVRDLKLFSQREVDERGPADVGRVLESSIGMAWNEIRHRARLTKDYGDTPPVHGSPARLGQVFLNLLVNAAQAIPEGDAEHQEVRVTTRFEEPSTVVVEIRDTGVGMPQDVVRRVFEPFFTTKPAGSGTGLGLSICQTLVHAAGGEITVKSELGRGSCVKVTLPASSEPVTASEPVPSAPVSSPRYRILIADDEPRVAITLRHLLSEHEVVMVSSGRTAIDALGKADVFYDAILCDLMMSDLTGMDVYEVVKLARPGTEKRMIFMTGGAFTPRATAFVASIEKENPCLEKPFPIDDLLKAIRKVARQ